MIRTALVTGGTRGIGGAITRALAAQGVQVVAAYARDHAAAHALQETCGAIPVCVDLSDPAAPAALAQEALERLGSVELLVNNAAVSYTNLFQCLSPEQVQTLYQVNLLSPVALTRALLPQMLSRHSGCIVNIASMWGEVGASCEVDYSVTKGALIAFTRALAKEVGPSGIRVNAVSPGVIATQMNAHLSAEDMQQLAEETPLGRIGTPEEVAAAVTWLASEAASFVTGQVLSVNGGFL